MFKSNCAILGDLLPFEIKTPFPCTGALNRLESKIASRSPLFFSGRRRFIVLTRGSGCLLNQLSGQTRRGREESQKRRQRQKHDQRKRNHSPGFFEARLEEEMWNKNNLNPDPIIILWVRV